MKFSSSLHHGSTPKRPSGTPDTVTLAMGQIINGTVLSPTHPSKASGLQKMELKGMKPRPAFLTTLRGQHELCKAGVLSCPFIPPYNTEYSQELPLKEPRFTRLNNHRAEGKNSQPRLADTLDSARPQVALSSSVNKEMEPKSQGQHDIHLAIS